MSGDTYTWQTNSPEETVAWGAALATGLTGGLVGLSGPLGAGKTYLTKGIARGLGVPADEPVVSPTFVLCREYAGRLRLFHLDAYRLGDSVELTALGLDEMLAAPEAVVVLEWADRFPDALPPDHLEIKLADRGPDQRELTVRFPEPPAASWLEALDAAAPRIDPAAR